MPVSDWSELCGSTIVWEKLQGRDAYGKPTGYDAPVTFAPPLGGRVFEGVYKYKDENGIFKQINGRVVWILATPEIKSGDRVYESGETTFLPIIKVDQPRDETGKHHTKVMFGKYSG